MRYGEDIFSICRQCGREIRVRVEDYSYRVYNKDNDSLHECFVKEWSLKDEK